MSKGGREGGWSKVKSLLTDIIPRSILMVPFVGATYLLCALGDGCLIYYHLDPDSGMLLGMSPPFSLPVGLETLASLEVHVPYTLKFSRGFILRNREKVGFMNFPDHST